jgi:hypothetical protein
LDENLGDEALLQKIDGAKQQIHEWDFNEMLNARTEARRRKEKRERFLQDYIVSPIVVWGSIAAFFYGLAVATPYVISGYASCKKYTEKLVNDVKHMQIIDKKNDTQHISNNVYLDIGRDDNKRRQYSVTVNGVVTNSDMPIDVETDGQNTTITTGTR